MAVLVNRTASVKKNGCAFLNFPAGIWGFCYFKFRIASSHFDKSLQNF